jgi:hypothetical protein
LVEEHADLCIAAGINFEASIKWLVASKNFSCLPKVLKTEARNMGGEIPIRSFDRKVRILYWVPP